MLVNSTSVKIIAFYFLLLEFLTLRMQQNNQGEENLASHSTEEQI